MIINIFDSHTHYDDPCFDGKHEALFADQKAKGVCGIINAGSSLKTSRSTVELAQKHDMVYAAVGVFPLETENLPEGWLNEIAELAKQPKVISIGEIGLDYFLPTNDREKQKAAFIAQMELAKDMNLPIQIHDRDADDDVLELVKKYRPVGEIHRIFSHPDYARAFTELGLYLAIGPQITYPDSEILIKTVQEMPLDKLLLETDCPYLAPHHLAGQQATSDMISFVCEKIAEIRGDVTAQQVADIALENTQRLYRL